MSTSKELSYNGSGVEGPSFNGSTEEELRSFLERFGLDTSGYGSGKAKTVEGLLEEVQKGETIIKILDDRPVRQVQVVCLFLRNDLGQILVEAKQVRTSLSQNVDVDEFVVPTAYILSV